VTLRIAEATAGWSFIEPTRLLPGLAEALSAQLRTLVGSWFIDEDSRVARLEVWRAGEIAFFHPAWLPMPTAPQAHPPDRLAGSVSGLRKAAQEAGVPIAWEPSTGGIELRFRM
jgi:hypothetical protein